MSFSQMLTISLGLILSENIVFSRALGLRAMLDAEYPRRTAWLTLRAAVGIVLTAMAAWPVDRFLLSPFGLEAARAPVYVLIAGILELVPELVLKKAAPSFGARFREDRPFLLLNVVVLGCALTLSEICPSFAELAVGAVSAALGYALASVILSSVLRRTRFAEPPACFEGAPLALVSAALIALAFAGFHGLHF